MRFILVCGYHEIYLVITCELQEVGVLVDAGCSNRECCICHAPVTDLGSGRRDFAIRRCGLICGRLIQIECQIFLGTCA